MCLAYYNVYQMQPQMHWMKYAKGLTFQYFFQTFKRATYHCGKIWYAFQCGNMTAGAPFTNID